jgi:glycerophosphoryl diester phosphodiesterase
LYGNIVNPKYWENGTINSNGGKGAGTTLYKRLVTVPFMRFLAPVTIAPKDGYSISVTTYNLDKSFESQFSAWSAQPFTFSNVDKLYKVVIKKTAEAVILPENIADYITAQTLVNTPFDRLLAEYANVKAVNHRGYNFIAPENTIIAYEMSAQRGFKYVETDVLFTSDGVPVLMHDDTINRTCCNASDGSAISSSVSIDSVSYEDLVTDYDACTPAQWSTWAGIKVPTFEGFMYCCKVHNLHPWIELKWTHTYTQAEVQEIISIVKQYGMEEHVSFISFSYDALALVASEWDTVELGLNGTVADAKLLRTGKNRVFMIYNQSNSYTDAIADGFEVCVYTVNTTAQLSALTNQGFDSVLTNGLLPSQVCDTVRYKYSMT